MGYSYPAGMMLSKEITLGRIDLTPNAESATLNTSHCVNAVVSDQNNQAIAGVAVNFTVTGANPQQGQVTADAQGVAQYCYTGLNAGEDHISSAVDTVAATAVTKQWEALVHGACGIDHAQTLLAAPANPLCLQGTASTVSSSDTGYSWSCNSSNGGTTASCAATRQYSVSSRVEGGHGSISASQQVAFHATPTFSLTPDPGYQLGAVTGSCGGALHGNQFSTQAVSASCTVVAHFDAIPVSVVPSAPEPVVYALNYSAAAHGSLSGRAYQVVAAGEQGASVTAVPEQGYHFDRWSDGLSTASRTDNNVSRDLQLTASFALNTYQLSYSAGANGSVTGSSTQTVKHGASGTELTAVPNAGFFFAKWSDGLTTANRTDRNVTGDMAVRAEFVAFCQSPKRFDSEAMIPVHFDLSCKLGTVTDAAYPEISRAIDLNSEALTQFDFTLWQQLQQLFSSKLPGSQVVLTAAGQVQVTLGQQRYSLLPVSVLKTASDAAPGIHVTNTGMVEMITAQQRSIHFTATPASLQTLQTALTPMGMQLNPARQGFGGLSIPANTGYYSLRPDSVSYRVSSLAALQQQAQGQTLSRVPGIVFLPYLEPDIQHLVSAYLIYADSEQQLWQQALPPVPADWESLRQSLEVNGYSEVQLHSNGVISGFKAGKRYRGIMDYAVKPGGAKESQLRFDAKVGDVNGDGNADMTVIFPSGEMQNLLLFPD